MNSIELFAGCGGLALGFEQAGINNVLVSELNKDACKTLRKNRPNWNVIEGDITNINFKPYQNIDLVSGGFPCQAFSYAGKKLGFSDARGTLFYQFARAIAETNPKIVVAENVKGLKSHDGGKTLETMVNILDELGYRVLPPTVLYAVNFRVPQRRERLIIVAIRKDIKQDFEYPKPENEIYTLRDALKAGKLFADDCPESEGQSYSDKKKAVLDLVPAGGWWKDLPYEVQEQIKAPNIMKIQGGSTGLARRLGWDEPSLTLLCTPQQNLTERCHPDFTRPLTIREYARVQTFPDDWEFCGGVGAQYKQIGNAVPVNLARAIGEEVMKFFGKIENDQ
jgi:DNA (cytosine-5)-methyltransferase 1